MIDEMISSISNYLEFIEGSQLYMILLLDDSFKVQYGDIKTR